MILSMLSGFSCTNLDFVFSYLIRITVLMSFGAIKRVVGFCTLRYAQLPNCNYLVQVCFLRS